MKILFFCLLAGVVLAIEPEFFPSHFQSFLDPRQSELTPEFRTQSLTLHEKPNFPSPYSPLDFSRKEIMNQNHLNFLNRSNTLYFQFHDRLDKTFRDFRSTSKVSQDVKHSPQMSSPVKSVQSNNGSSEYFVYRYCGNEYPSSGYIYPLNICFNYWVYSYNYVSFTSANQLVLQMNFFPSSDCSGPTFQTYSSSATQYCQSDVIASIVNSSELPGGFMINYYNQNPDGSYDCSLPIMLAFSMESCLFQGCASSLLEICSSIQSSNTVSFTITSYSSSETCGGNSDYTSTFSYFPLTCNSQSSASFSCSNNNPIYTNLVPGLPSSSNQATPQYYIQYNPFPPGANGQSGFYQPLDVCVVTSSGQSSSLKASEKDGVMSLYQAYYCSQDCTGEFNSTLVSSSPNTTSSIVDANGLPGSNGESVLESYTLNNNQDCNAPPSMVSFISGCQSNYAISCAYSNGQTIQISSYYDSANCSSAPVSQYVSSSSAQCVPYQYIPRCLNPVPYTFPPSPLPTSSPVYTPSPTSPSAFPTFSPTNTPLTAGFVIETNYHDNSCSGLMNFTFAFPIGACLKSFSSNGAPSGSRSYSCSPGENGFASVNTYQDENCDNLIEVQSFGLGCSYRRGYSCSVDYTPPSSEQYVTRTFYNDLGCNGSSISDPLMYASFIQDYCLRITDSRSIIFDSTSQARIYDVINCFSDTYSVQELATGCQFTEDFIATSFLKHRNLSFPSSEWTVFSGNQSVSPFQSPREPTFSPTTNNFPSYFPSTQPTGTQFPPKIFNYTGASQVYEVPSGVFYLNVQLWGAGGGAYNNGAGAGGFVQAIIEVTPGQIFYVYVGGAGQSMGYCNYGGAGFNGGGNGLCGGGGGGGGTDIRLNQTDLTSRVLVAGGGGGGAYGSEGGCGGGLTACGAPHSTGGGQNYGGQQVLFVVTDVPDGWNPNGNGTMQSGSNGEVCGTYCCGSAGGGGGGWYGGGGGVCDQGGAGGSSHVDSDVLVELIANLQCYQLGNGFAVITPTSFHPAPSFEPTSLIATFSPTANLTYFPTPLPTHKPSLKPSAEPSSQSPSSSLQVFVLGQYNFEINGDNSEQTRLTCDSSDGPSSPPVGYYYPLDYCFSNGEQASYQYSALNFGSFLSLSVVYYGSTDCSGSGASSQVFSRVSSSCAGIINNDPSNSFQQKTGAIISEEQIPAGIVTDSYPCVAGSGCSTYSCSQFETRKVIRTGLCVSSPDQKLSFSASCGTNFATYNKFIGGEEACSSSYVIHTTYEHPDQLCSNSSQLANYCTHATPNPVSNPSIPTIQPSFTLQPTKIDVDDDDDNSSKSHPFLNSTDDSTKPFPGTNQSIPSLYPTFSSPSAPHPPHPNHPQHPPNANNHSQPTNNNDQQDSSSSSSSSQASLSPSNTAAMLVGIFLGVGMLSAVLFYVFRKMRKAVAAHSQNSTFSEGSASCSIDGAIEIGVGPTQHDEANVENPMIMVNNSK